MWVRPRREAGALRSSVRGLEEQGWGAKESRKEEEEDGGKDERMVWCSVPPTRRNSQQEGNQ